MKLRVIALSFIVLLLGGAMSGAMAAEKKKVIIDTDIGDDIDDAYALALALTSPELEIVGIATAHGATDRRARLVRRLLYETGMDSIPVVAGVKTSDNGFAQYAWAEGFTRARAPERNVVDFYIENLNRYPGEITIIAIGPMTNIGALIDRDPAAFKKAKEIVIMGGAVEFSYDDLGYGRPTGPAAEYNIKTNIPASRRLFAGGVPIIMAGLEVTNQLKLDEVKRGLLFRKSTPLTDALAVLYHLWGAQTPTLFDDMAVAMAIDPTLCEMRPMHIEVDDQGITRRIEGKPANARVCYEPQVDRFFRLLMPRLMNQNLRRTE